MAASTHRPGGLLRILKNAGWIGMLTPLDVIFGLARTAMLARMLGADGFGLLSTLLATVQLCDGALRLNSAETVMSFVSARLADEDVEGASALSGYCYLTDALTSLLAVAAVLAVAWGLGHWFGVPRSAAPMLSIFGVSIFLRATSIDSRALVRLADRYRWEFFLLAGVGLFTTCGIGAIFFSGSNSLMAVIWVMTIVAAGEGLVGLMLGQRAMTILGFRQRPRLTLSIGADGAKIRRFQLTSSVRMMVKSVSKNADILLIGALAKPHDVGIYRAAKQLSGLLRAAAASAVTAIYPEYSRLYHRGDLLALRRLVLRLLLAFSLLGLVSAALITLLIDPIVYIALGPEFVAAKQVILILLLSVLLLVAVTPLYSLPAAAGHAGPALAALLFGAGAQAVCMVLLVPRIGAQGAAWSMMAFSVAWIATLLPGVLRILRTKGNAETVQ
ncbi:MAG: lipopolysaccharide biosynthesis protein [Deltaproteobacteria bacterium]|nr:lipopolysaccharide biosynthesis protein [Deltaproteobacteria bacterium]